MNHEDDEEIRDQFSKIDINNTDQLRTWFESHPELTIIELAIILNKSEFYILNLRRKAGIRSTLIVEDGKSVIKLSNYRETINRYTDRNWRGQWLIDQHKAGVSILAISKKVNRSRFAVRDALKRAGLYNKPVYANPYMNREWLYQNYVVNGYNQSQCARLAGVSRYALRRWLINFRIKLKDRHVWLRSG